MESSSMVAESEEEGVPGPSKKMKVEIMGPTENEEELEENKHCIQCCQDGAKCFTRPGSMKTSQSHTCSHCKTKKAACSFNKDNSASITLGGCQLEWQVWKAYLLKHHCKEFLVEDLDPQEEILDGKVRKAWKPYEPDLGIAALDSLFILDNDPKRATTSENEDEDSLESEEELESMRGEEDVLVEGAENVEMMEVVKVVQTVDT
ncbi:uncharacterized protein ARMOST_06972 [Armillaria ostoyae]|uniref:Uncharacterized protein n=1 Tax=Armillaria ostoyae TaxID=47428 RepID=A0A284R4J5_ARMOS|nr:uncharacterized protein ARMOST_06972 [Armillaria ostoyae]